MMNGPLRGIKVVQLGGIGPVEFIGLRLLLCLGLGTGGFFVFGLAGQTGTNGLILTLVLAMFGYLMPNIWLDRKGKARKKDIQRSLPDAIDLMAISIPGTKATRSVVSWRIVNTSPWLPRTTSW